MNKDLQAKITYTKGKLDALYQVIDLLDEHPNNSDCIFIKLALQPTIETLTAILEVAERNKLRNNYLTKMMVDNTQSDK